MNIIFYMENNRAGGVDTFFINLIKNLPTKKDQLILICNSSHPGLEVIKKTLKEEISIVTHNIPISWVIINKFFFIPEILQKYLNQILKILLFPLQYFLLKKLFLSIEGDRLMVINGSYPGGETSRIANIAWKNIGRKKGIHNIHNFATKVRTVIKPIESFIDKLLLDSVSNFIGVSQICTNSLKIREHFKNIENLKTIYNGVPIPKVKINHSFNIRKELGISKGYICLMLANYEERKGHKFLFRAFDIVHSYLPDAHLVVVGDSGERERKKVEHLKNNSKSNKNIHLLNFYEKGCNLIYQSDLLIVASQKYESFGLTVAESMIRKVPVVSTNVGGLKEVIGENGYAAFALSPNNYKNFAEKIILCLTDEEVKKRLIGNGYRRVSNNFEVKRMCKNYYDIITK